MKWNCKAFDTCFTVFCLSAQYSIEAPDSVISQLIDDITYGNMDYATEDIADITVDELLSLSNPENVSTLQWAQQETWLLN